MFLDMIIMMNDDKNVINIYILYFTHVTLSINVLSLKVWRIMEDREDYTNTE